MLVNTTEMKVLQKRYLSISFINQVKALPKQSLSKDIISECISMPYRLGYGFSHAFVKLDCTDRLVVVLLFVSFSSRNPAEIKL